MNGIKEGERGEERRIQKAIKKNREWFKQNNNTKTWLYVFLVNVYKAQKFSSGT